MTSSDLISLASEIGIALFTGLVAVLELTRFLQGPKISFLLGRDERVLYVVPGQFDSPPFNRQVNLVVPVVISNNGSRGGVITEVDVQMIIPTWQVGPTKAHPSSMDKIELAIWGMSMGNNPYFFSSGNPGHLSIRDNESVGSTLTLTIFLSNDVDHAKPPNFTLSEIEKMNPIFRFAIHYKTIAGRKRELIAREKEFSIKPHFVAKGDLPPRWMIEREEKE